MDFIETVKRYQKFCKSFQTCGACPLAKWECDLTDATEEEMQHIIEVIEKWEKEPKKEKKQNEDQECPYLEEGKYGTLHVEGDDLIRRGDVLDMIQEEMKKPVNTDGSCADPLGALVVLLLRVSFMKAAEK